MGGAPTHWVAVRRPANVATAVAEAGRVFRADAASYLSRRQSAHRDKPSIRGPSASRRDTPQTNQQHCIANARQRDRASDFDRRRQIIFRAGSRCEDCVSLSGRILGHDIRAPGSTDSANFPPTARPPACAPACCCCCDCSARESWVAETPPPISTARQTSMRMSLPRR